MSGTVQVAASDSLNAHSFCCLVPNIIRSHRYSAKWKAGNVQKKKQKRKGLQLRPGVWLQNEAPSGA